MYRHILVPLDGSALAEAVVPHVAILASRAGARVTLLQVVPPVPPVGRPELSPFQAKALMCRETMDYLSRVRDRLTALQAEVEVQEGVPAETIIDTAASKRVDLIAMSTHGRSGLGRWVYGSVADKVLRGAEVPVLLVRVTKADAKPVRTPREVYYQRILVPLDGSLLAEQALPHAEALASLFDSDLVLLRVPLLPGYAYATIETLAYSLDREVESSAAESEEYLARVGARLRERGLKVSSVVEWGSVAETIVDYAQGSAADLIVMSTHGRSGVGRWVYGSVADRVLRGAGVPVLLIRAYEQESKG